MSEDRFEFSNLPNYLEWYECYDDLSNKKWVNGSELKLNKGIWDGRAITKWDFFYRPFGPAVGRPQKKMIREREASVNTCKEYISQCRMLIEAEQRRKRRAMVWLGVWWMFLSLFASWLAKIDTQLLILPGIGVVFSLWRLNLKWSKAQAEIKRLLAKIDEYEKGIRKNINEIQLLEGEIAQLLTQVPSVPKALVVENWLREEIKDMECVCLGEFLSQSVTLENIEQYLPQHLGTETQGLFMRTWGSLQPVTQRGPLGLESTGLRRAKDQLKERSLTWRVGMEGQPIFRLQFFQYIFPLGKNLNICTFFYDMVTRQMYGRRLETFQYNHVTNYALREVEAQEESWIEDYGSSTVAGLLHDKVLKAFTIAVSSGNHFRFIVVDDDIVGFMNEWMKHEEKFHELEASISEFQGDKQGASAWKAAEKAKLEEERNKLIDERQEVRWYKGYTGRAILASVRNCIESYIVQSQARD
jgi:hypothetical protein